MFRSCRLMALAMVSLGLAGCLYPRQSVVLIEPCYVSPLLEDAGGWGTGQADGLAWSGVAGCKRYVRLELWPEGPTWAQDRTVMLSAAGSEGVAVRGP